MPIDLRSPGLAWRRRGGLRVAYWIARGDAVKKGYPIRSQRLWKGEDEPTEDELQTIRFQCHRLQGEMRDWIKNPNRDRSRNRNRPGFVYFVKSSGQIKIGFSKDAIKRVIALRTGSAEAIELLGTIPATLQIERFIHWQFRSFRIHGEWFRADPELVSFIERNLVENKGCPNNIKRHQTSDLELIDKSKVL